MDLESKFEVFSAGETLPATTVPESQAHALGIRLHRSFFADAFCEPHAASSSVRLGKGASVFIGRHSYINSGGHLRGELFIGRYCSVGRLVSVGAATHGLEGLSTSPALSAAAATRYSDEEREYLFGTKRPPRSPLTRIDSDVWVGDGAVVLPGVRLGVGAVVGANAVVTHDVDPYQVVAGMPARPIRLRFPPTVVERLLASRWWNRPHAQLRQLPTGHVLRFLDNLESLPVIPAADRNYRLRL